MGFYFAIGFASATGFWIAMYLIVDRWPIRSIGPLTDLGPNPSQQDWEEQQMAIKRYNDARHAQGEKGLYE